MSKLLSFFETAKTNKKLFEIARQLRNSEFKNESVDYVMDLITTGHLPDEYHRF